MLKLTSTPVSMALAMIALAGCGKPAATQPEASSSKYILWGAGHGCLGTRAEQPVLKMCVTGTGDLARAQDMTAKAVGKWLAAIRPLADDVATGVEFACDGHQDGNVNLSAGDGIATGGQGTVNIFDQSAFGTYLHEFGHAFACIGDTYVNGTAGQCMPEQPHSVMCDGLLRDNLSSDDVAAVRQQFAGHNGVSPTPAFGDADGDGVDDGLDRCPATAAGAAVWHLENDGVFAGCAQSQTALY
jgi:hypothetical protein